MRGGRQAMSEQGHGEMRAFSDADGGTHQCHPGEQHLAQLLDPEEVDRIEPELVGDRHHDVAQEDAHEHDADRDQQQRTDEQAGGRDDRCARHRQRRYFNRRLQRPCPTTQCIALCSRATVCPGRAS